MFFKIAVTGKTTPGRILI